MRKRILYIEDNPSNMLLVRRIIEAEGYEMLEATDGETGWDTIARERPDFILMDLYLPGIDGLELTRIVKNDPQLQSIPIVALTAHGDVEIEEAARRAGCDGFLHKPANVQQVRDMIRQFLGPSQ
ncbi:MAG: response regulator, partial [Phycisphaerae bacterium]|nr:response regulator [Phycisphaerae bacterium]NIW45444.1 response regulator [Gammaproteobacteria bacterium]NIX30552.1 response regulator [Phycisphaerae bacterium]